MPLFQIIGPSGNYGYLEDEEGSGSDGGDGDDTTGTGPDDEDSDYTGDTGAGRQFNMINLARKMAPILARK